ncbi:hypothetical protein NLJ89_g8282 [Agrocybe chaxingu]|uniref:Thymidylate kinase-like domain-containing protein n=1 Tax=Agrocybe chaxingu TaxID=84603 RepID=A0A9W8JUZ9_9AGAR|nr:hypothetical protein NLJ89_g8282 [Agrocybe chaxingu]
MPDPQREETPTENTSKRAPFIVIEGNGGTDATLFKFPDRRTAIGQMIDAYLRSTSELDDHAIHLLFSANRWELASTIEKLLTAGTTVVCDRYAFSGISFSASKVNADGTPILPFEWCRSPDVGLPAPDLVLFFDITPEKAKERGGYGEERLELKLSRMRRQAQNG